MKKYICSNCGYILEKDNIEEEYICPMCNSTSDKFNKLENSFLNLEEIIDSVVEEALDEKKNKIVNDILEDNKIRISDQNPSIARIVEKCINCGQCRKTCEKQVNISYDLNLCKDPICIGCGQCILNCPTGALIPKYCYKEVKQIMDANEKIVVALISPAVRVSIGESFGIASGENSEEKLVSALKKVGFDYVFDTAFGADLTILEEVSEFASRLANKGPLPQFTSCCPAWVKYAEIYHPELIEKISSCKSPIGMQCAIIKSYFCEEKGFDPNKVVTVAITPCTAKKMEAKEYTINIDYVMTCSELSILLKEEDINIENMPDSKFDQILGESSGSGIMFGTTGGVCESVVRTLNRIMTKTNLKKEDLIFEELRGYDGIKTATININNYNLRVAVVHQMENLEKLLENDYYKKFHFIEVMNCKGGCVGGGGQPLCPIKDLDKYRENRSKGLFDIDKKRAVRCSHDNKELKLLYKNFLKQPLSEESFKLLHTSYTDKSNLLNNKNQK